jgi:Tfp pilus assembly protein PilF
MTAAGPAALALVAALAAAPEGGGEGGWRAITGTVAAPDAGAVPHRPAAAAASAGAAAADTVAEPSAEVERLRAAFAQNPGSAEIADELGYAMYRLGARAEAEAMYRRAVELDARRAPAYVNFAELVSTGADRWQRRDEVLAFLRRGLAALGGDTRGRQSVELALAGFEASVGQLAAARDRVRALLAEPLPLGLQKRAQDRLQAIEEEERARALADWPEPRLPAAALAAVEAAEQALRRDDAAGALARVEPVVLEHPAATGPRYLRARALEALGRHDEASRELRLLVQVRPSHAGALRLYGTILAEHFGALEAERADEALRRALALEPSWDDLRELRRKVAHMRAVRRGAAGVEPPLPAPTPVARAQFDEAQRWMGVDAPAVAADALRRALAESPAYADAAVSLYALTGEEPRATVQALWDHGGALARLAGDMLRTNREDVADRVRPWLDRAVALGAAEARFERALLHVQAGEAEAALADLSAYVASDVAPPRLAEATALRSQLLPGAQASSPEARARMLLLADRPAEAARVLGGSCRAGVAAANLLGLGRIEEYERRPGRALACYRLALAAPAAAGEAGRRAALERIALVGGYAPAGELRGYRGELEQAAAQGIAAAEWALSSLAASQGSWGEAAARAEAFLSRAAADDPLRPRVRAALDGLAVRASEHQARRSLWLRLGLGLAGLLTALLVVLLARRLRRRSVAGALARVPGLYPDVAAVVAELRHDVLKHRASALGLAAADPEARAEVHKLLLEPAPASVAVAEAYERLRRAAAVAGVAVARLEREPVFGPLARKLAQAEALLDRPPGPREAAALAAIDSELRETVGPALAELLAAAPRTRLDPADMARWMRAGTSEGEAGDTAANGGAGHGAGNGARPPLQPGLHLPALDLELPITPEALHTIISNLVRNAVSALASARDPRVLLRVEEGRDAAGRQLVTFLVADSAPATLSLADIEQRDGQRGLGIVRDLVRRWGGYLVVRPEPAPFVKAVGAAFPLTPAPPPS